jgi:hypothetical protein
MSFFKLMKVHFLVRKLFVYNFISLYYLAFEIKTSNNVIQPLSYTPGLGLQF